jgi:hypothetical protein
MVDALVTERAREKKKKHRISTWHCDIFFLFYNLLAAVLPQQFRTLQNEENARCTAEQHRESNANRQLGARKRKVLEERLHLSSSFFLFANLHLTLDDLLTWHKAKLVVFLVCSSLTLDAVHVTTQ